MIGDKDEDIKASHKAGADNILPKSKDTEGKSTDHHTGKETTPPR